jgi:hypothetical protein
LMLLLLTPIALAGYFVFWGRSPVPTSIVASVIFVLLLEKLEGRMDEIAERVARDRTRPPQLTSRVSGFCATSMAISW